MEVHPKPRALQGVIHLYEFKAVMLASLRSVVPQDWAARNPISDAGGGCVGLATWGVGAVEEQGRGRDLQCVTECWTSRRNDEAMHDPLVLRGAPLKLPVLQAQRPTVNLI